LTNATLLDFTFADDINDSRMVTLSGFLDVLPGFNVFVWSEKIGLVGIGEGGAGFIDDHGNVAGTLTKTICTFGPAFGGGGW
jgi:hypothetical protein